LNAHEQLSRVKKIIDDFSNIAKEIRESKPGSVNISQTLNYVVFVLDDIIKKKNIELNLDIYDDEATINGGSQELEQVFLNVINNAVYAVESKQGKRQISVKVDKNDTENIIKISDNGNGISDEIKHRIFEPFFTTKPAGEASGLGLTFCQEIVKKYNGNITFRSEKGKGTTIIIAFPL
jgi:signal transduction histidine kinase